MRGSEGELIDVDIIGRQVHGVMAMAGSQQGLFGNVPFAFADRFLADHAGQIIIEPRTAVLELIANAYDAGATKITIQWPLEKGGEFSVTDNGTGMTREEVEERWKTLCYDRAKRQGNAVVFPPGVKGLQRTAFGKSGKGRFAPFCFSDSYQVVTWKNGTSIEVGVNLSPEGQTPFSIDFIAVSEKSGHGTTISATVEKHLLLVEDLRQLIGSKFLVDPSLSISVNGRAVQLLALEGLKTTVLDAAPHGSVTVHFIDSIEHYRTAQLRGITWWVNQRMVGEPSWDRLDDEGAYLDGRTEQAKRFSFIVEANFMKEDVKSDWSGYHANQRVTEVRQIVHRYVLQEIQRHLAGSRKQRKKAALENSRHLLGELPTVSKKALGQFIDEVQESCPTISERDLCRTVEVFAKLEQSRSGYDLLAQLALCSPDDLDRWNAIMSQWTASNAEIVLSELQRRLTLIARMQSLVESPLTDELHDLQPLFERGLWIFGPEYEAVDFRSNRGLAEVIGKFLGGADYKPSRQRPDVVVLPETSIGAYCADAYDAAGEISGIRKVAVLELKKGGFCVAQKEMDQAMGYCKEIRKGGRVQPSTEIVAYVLGAKLESDLDTMTMGSSITVIPMVYQTILRKAHQRTFNLQRRLEEAQPVVASDPEVDEVAQQAKSLFQGGV
jgi:Histidine kinase-, DNA gyrase B-, and HSP90-like ATPase